MMKGYELKVKHQVNSRVSLIKKGKARKYWKRESLKKHACMLPLIFSMFECTNNFHTSGKK